MESGVGGGGGGAGEGGLARRVWEESKRLWRVGVPAMLIRLCTFGSFIVTQSFVGRSGQTETDLAAFGLVFSLLIRLSHGITVGMGSATETLCGQAFGAKQYAAMGVYLQRSWLVLGGTATLLLPLFLFTPAIFRALGQGADLAAAAGPVALEYLPYHYAYIFHVSIQMYLQSQLKNSIIAWISVPSFLLHLLLSWLAVAKLGWGVAGAMASLGIYSWTPVAGEFVYICGGWCPRTWTGFSREAFAELWPVMKLSVSSGVMVCLQMWYNSVPVFLAGYMKNAKIAVAALSICINISTWSLMISLGLLTAVSVRVSNELGKGDAKAAKFALKVALANSAALGLLFLLLFLAVGKRISYAFTSSEAVAESVAGMQFLLVLSVVPNTIQSVLGGAAIGAGYQSVVAIVNVASYYIIGLPLGIMLGYMTRLHVKGIWLGMLCGAAVQILVISTITIRTNWDDQVEKAKARLSRWSVMSQDEASNVYGE